MREIFFQKCLPPQKNSENEKKYGKYLAHFVWELQNSLWHCTNVHLEHTLLESKVSKKICSILGGQTFWGVEKNVLPQCRWFLNQADVLGEISTISVKIVTILTMTNQKLPILKQNVLFIPLKSLKAPKWIR